MACGGRRLDGTVFNPVATLKALSYFEDGTLPRLPQAVKARLLQAASTVDLDRLPACVPVTRSGPAQ